ncbi:MAG: hypothetical protein ACYCWW_04350 [Deltaproteobacteria bacterium]
MPLVRKEDFEELLDDALSLLSQGALHQAVGALLSLARRVAKSGKGDERARAAAAIGDLLSRPDLLGMTAEEDAQLRAALANLRESAAG